MLQNAHVLTFVAFLVSFQSLNSAVSSLDCKAQVKCDFKPPLAWATDGRNCKVFYNTCHLRNHNCQLQDEGKATLTNTSLAQCLQNCRKGCTKEMDPVCTEHSGGLKTFGNPCLWAQEMCKTCKAYVYSSQGPCENLIKKTKETT